MKILPNLTLIQGQKQTTTRRPTKPVAVSTENKVTETGAQDATVSFSKVMEVVSLENHRAMSGAPPKDLSEAQSVLEQVQQQLEEVNRKDLKNIHRLEGLLHFYSV